MKKNVNAFAPITQAELMVVCTHARHYLGELTEEKLSELEGTDDMKEFYEHIARFTGRGLGSARRILWAVVGKGKLEGDSYACLRKAAVAYTTELISYETLCKVIRKHTG